MYVTFCCVSHTAYRRNGGKCPKNRTQRTNQPPAESPYIRRCNQPQRFSSAKLLYFYIFVKCFVIYIVILWCFIDLSQLCGVMAICGQLGNRQPRREPQRAPESHAAGCSRQALTTSDPRQSNGRSNGRRRTATERQGRRAGRQGMHLIIYIYVTFRFLV